MGVLPSRPGFRLKTLGSMQYHDSRLFGCSDISGGIWNKTKE